ncbi:dihydrofolate reductase [Modestobacter sp. I12A-02628]|uniref:Dihydrofolate reductase n=1 Tax=Goekera deserti TaxID=2497753 RepID=A0A7K3WIB0_9ACTN|nr:dihydrofolate reductase [Goekera deserti]NDI46998.1 dihydrofolate reductase [Goekera deserti]NEL56235.1 dihydrofolate reductase [Goekera deserti]
MFLGLSVDGYIARHDGDLTWLTSRGQAAGDAGYTEFMAGIDAVVLGRTTYQVVAGFSEWPYGERPVHVLSTTLGSGDDPRVTVHRSLPELVAALEQAGSGDVYLDGGLVVRSFLAAGLVDELTLSQVPVLLGEGVSLFGPLPHDIDLEHVRTQVFGGGMVQTTYRVHPGWSGT